MKEKKAHKIGGRKPKLCEEDRVHFMLEYYRECRTLQHMGIDYGISEGQASKVVKDVETVLIKSGKFSLPKKMPEHSDKMPLGCRENTIQERKNNILKKFK